MKHLLTGVALLLSGVAATAADSCSNFEHQGTVDTGLEFRAEREIPGIDIDSSLAQMRAILIDEEEFLLGDQTNDGKQGTLKIEQKANKKSRGFPLEFTQTREGKATLYMKLPTQMNAGPKPVRKFVCGLLEKIQLGPKGEQLAARGREYEKSPEFGKYSGPQAAVADADFRPAPPLAIEQIGEWWAIDGRGQKPSRETLFADAKSVKAATDAAGKPILEVIGSRLFESADSPIDYIVFKFQVRCEAREVRIPNVSVTSRDTLTLEKITPIDWAPAKGNWLERVRDFACEPKKRDKKSAMMVRLGESQFDKIAEVIWATLWEDGTRPAVTKYSKDDVNATRAATAAELAKEFEEE